MSNWILTPSFDIVGWGQFFGANKPNIRIWKKFNLKVTSRRHSIDILLKTILNQYLEIKSSSRLGDMPILALFQQGSKPTKGLRDIQKICNYWITIKNIPGMSQKLSQSLSHPEQEISLYWYNFSMEISKLNDWQTSNNFFIIWNYCTNIPGRSQKISGIYLIQKRRHLYICLISVCK